MHKNTFLNSDFQMINLFRIGTSKMQEFVVNSYLYADENKTKKNYELIVTAPKMSDADLQFYLAIIYLCSNNEGIEYLDKNVESKIGKELYQSLFPNYDFESNEDSAFIDYDLDSIILNTSVYKILMATGRSDSSIETKRFITSLRKLSKVHFIYSGNDVEYPAMLLTYKLKKNSKNHNYDINITIHPRIAASILRDYSYKYFNLDKHNKLKLKMSKIANYHLCNRVWQGKNSEIYLDNFLSIIIEDFDSKKVSYKRKLRSDFINKIIPELIFIGWKISVEEKNNDKKLVIKRPKTNL